MGDFRRAGLPGSGEPSWLGSSWATTHRESTEFWACCSTIQMVLVITTSRCFPFWDHKQLSATSRFQEPPPANGRVPQEGGQAWVRRAALLSLPTLLTPLPPCITEPKAPAPSSWLPDLSAPFQEAGKLRGCPVGHPAFACKPRTCPPPVQAPTASYAAPLDFILSWATEPITTDNLQLKQNKTKSPFMPGIFQTLTYRPLPTIFRYLLNWGQNFFHVIN